MSESAATANAALQALPPIPRTKKVTVVGAGIAGLTTAYRLAQRGYDVTILEAQSVAGGNLAGIPSEDGQSVFEVYPHMFGDWYDNFWALMTDIGVTRERDFEARPICGFLRAGEFPRYRLLRDNGSPQTAIPNLLSGVISAPNMFLSAFAIIDLLTQDFDRDDLASEQSLNGFIISRSYATLEMARFFQLLVLNIWSVDSYSTAAGAYQAFAKYQFRRPAPQCWVLRTNSHEAIIQPLCAALERLGCRFRLNAKLVGVSINPASNTVMRIAVEEPDRSNPGATGAARGVHLEQVENLVLAITPAALHDVILHRAEAPPTGLRQGPLIAQVPIVDVLPELADTRGLAMAPIPVIHVTFKRTLPDIPEYYIALTGSRYSLTFVKSAALSASSDGNTVLVLAASDFNALPVDLDFAPFERAMAPTHAQATAMFLILTEFHRYVPTFKLGRYCGDPDSDIDWQKTGIGSGSNQKLFINQVGSKHTSPYTHYAAIENLYFAGENRDNPITITTVEAAACSGNQAAQAICRDVGQAPGVAPVNVLVPETYPMAALLAWKFALAPYAAAAKCWATLEEALGGDRVDDWRTAARPAPLGPGHMLTQIVTAGSDVYSNWLSAYGSALSRVVREFGNR